MEIENIHEEYRQEVIARQEAETLVHQLQMRLESEREYRKLLSRRMSPRIDAYLCGYYRAKVESGEYLSDIGAHDLEPALLEELRSKAKVDLEQ